MNPFNYRKFLSSTIPQLSEYLSTHWSVFHPYLSVMSVCRGEMASSSVDSLSPGSEGAGAPSAREVFYMLIHFNSNVFFQKLRYTFLSMKQQQISHHLWNMYSTLHMPYTLFTVFSFSTVFVFCPADNFPIRESWWRLKGQLPQKEAARRFQSPRFSPLHPIHTRQVMHWTGLYCRRRLVMNRAAIKCDWTEMGEAQHVSHRQQCI